MECIFCKIVNKDLNTPIIFENNTVIAFDDINPQAPHHKLIIPRRHIATINELTPNDNEVVTQMLITAQHLAKELHLAEQGYRLVFNCNRQGGQEVFHIHLHLLAGRQMQWPPG